VIGPVGFADGHVERRLAGIGQRVVDVGALFDEELAQPPVTVKGRAIQTKVVA